MINMDEQEHEPATLATSARWTIVLPHYYNARSGLTFEHNPKSGNLRLTLTGNSRHHPMKRSQIVRRLRESTAALVTAHNVPAQDYVTATVELHHPEKGAKYVRDTDNLVAMGKPIFDALQPARPARQSPKTGKWSKSIPGAGVVPDDSPKFMRKLYGIRRGSDFRPFPCIVLHIDGVAW